MSAAKPTLLDTAIASIINEMAKGTAPWRKPWKTSSGGVLPRRSTGETFSGMNAILLSTIQMAHGYSSPYWLTFQQALALDSCVRKGERGSPAILYKTRVVPCEGEAGDGASAGSYDRDPDRILRFLKSYAVFNACQIDGLPERFFPVALAPEPDIALDPAIERIMARFPTPVSVGGDRACYYPATDRIQMPPRTAFDTDADYVATLLHEFAHATGHSSRLDRFKTDGVREAYAREELVAELTSHLVSLHLGLAPSEAVFHNHVAYLSSWVSMLRDKPGELLKAAGKAQAACDLILACGCADDQIAA
ncbi:ArdC family protein [Asticcacaulis sp. YBE204]|uniref:ArdC family protein n=1 Tax=Asticcacaulis sp. YBE204 TaxID=1282363 RepID=UPI0003C3F625|nr:zincin-like metallopeptidase domain-containing protein [Asticcacaulis sp. YBE204]ESQ79263.1 hypothetical protein AEYBE204_09650 [Asticcacaulis sp. YBE204]